MPKVNLPTAYPALNVTYAVDPVLAVEDGHVPHVQMTRIWIMMNMGPIASVENQVSTRMYSQAFVNLVILDIVGTRPSNSAVTIKLSPKLNLSLNVSVIWSVIMRNKNGSTRINR